MVVGRWWKFLPPLLLFFLAPRRINAQCNTQNGQCNTQCYGDCCYMLGSCTASTSQICADEFPSEKNVGMPPSYGEKLSSHGPFPNIDGCFCATADITVYNGMRFRFSTPNPEPRCATAFYGNASVRNCWGTLQCLGGTCSTTGVCRVRGILGLVKAANCF